MDASTYDAKTRILLAAKKLFAEQGFDATTVRQICVEADVNVAMVSYHFGGKENMFYAIFEHFFPSNALAEHAETLNKPIDGLKLIISEVIRYIEQDAEMGILLKREVLMQSPRTEVIRRYVHPIWLKLREILDQGRAIGVFRFQSLDHALLFTIAALIFPRGHAFLEPLLEHHSHRTEEIIEHTTQFVFGGLGYMEP